MAEPRRPRIIRSHPDAQTPGSQSPDAQPLNAPTPETPSFPLQSSGPQTSLPESVAPELGAGDVSGAQSAAAVRSTSSKISVSAVPVHGSPSSRAIDGEAAPKKEPLHVKTTGASAGLRKWRTKFKPPGTSGNGENSDPSRLASSDPRSDAKVLAFPVRARRKLRRGVVIAATSGLVVVALIMAVALFSPVLAVKTVAFDGRKLIAEKTLMTALQPIMGKPLTQVTGPEVIALLAGVPQVKDSWIEARPPSTLVVHVVERVPVALLKKGNGFLLVDPDGVQLGTAADASKVALPVIDGANAVIGKATFSAIAAVLATLPASILSKLSSANAKSPDAVELNMIDGKLVVWGNATDSELKAEVLEALLNVPSGSTGPDQPAPAAVKVYDVSTPRYPVTR